MSDYDYTDLTTGDDLTDSEMEDRYQDALDEIYGEVDIAGHSFFTGRVLRELDEIAFREGFNNWIDSEVQDGNYREYVDSPVCEDCEATLTQDDVTESLANYDRLVCPSCGDGDDDCEATGTTEEGVRLLCTEVGEHDEHTAERFEYGDQGYRLVTIAGVTWDED